MKVDVQKLLTTRPPAFSQAAAERIALDHFGIQANSRPQVSERDQNFRLDASDGVSYILKIANHAEQPQVVDFQNQALRHIATMDPSIPVPRVIPTCDGHLYCQVENAGRSHIVRVLSWLDGVLLETAKPTQQLASQLGKMLAQLGLALQDFDHPGSNPPLLWDMKHASDLRELLAYIESPQLGRSIEQILNRFDSHVIARLAGLRTQVIHNDLNPGNVLLGHKDPQRISGVIDFGDLVKSPLIIDLAVAAAYRLSRSDDPLAGALPLIAAYHTIRPLQTMEIELLPDLIKTRLITGLLINAYRTGLFPENREYLMHSREAAIHKLAGLNDLSANEALDRIVIACQV